MMRFWFFPLFFLTVFSGKIVFQEHIDVIFPVSFPPSLFISPSQGSISILYQKAENSYSVGLEYVFDDPSFQFLKLRLNRSSILDPAIMTLFRGRIHEMTTFPLLHTGIYTIEAENSLDYEFSCPFWAREPERFFDSMLLLFKLIFYIICVVTSVVILVKQRHMMQPVYLLCYIMLGLHLISSILACGVMLCCSAIGDWAVVLIWYIPTYSLLFLTLAMASGYGLPQLWVQERLASQVKISLGMFTLIAMIPLLYALSFFDIAFRAAMLFATNYSLLAMEIWILGQCTYLLWKARHDINFPRYWFALFLGVSLLHLVWSGFLVIYFIVLLAPNRLDTLTIDLEDQEKNTPESVL